jgi:hypothetical protein
MTPQSDQIVNILSGADKSIPREQAINALVMSDISNKHQHLETLLKNSNESLRIRYQAAINLGKVGTAEARNTLEDSSRMELDDKILAGIMKSLGRIGDRHSLDFVLQAKQRTTGSASLKANFAAALISYRHGLTGNELPMPQDSEFLSISDSLEPIYISPAGSEEIKICLQSLSNKLFGIELDDKNAYKLQYRQAINIVLFNREFVDKDKIRILRERKSLLGLVADQHPADSSLYSVAYLLLTSPSNEESDKIEIIIPEPEGTIMFAGTAKFHEDLSKFLIRSVSQRGAFPIIIEGAFRENRLKIKRAQFSPKIHIQKLPMKNG